ncbi:MAG: hypothetical protein ACYTBJ_10305 [Planctomycetota bacterium]|jgi:hypothetical protein
MHSLVLETVLAARRGDDTGWVQILVYIIVAGIILVRFLVSKVQTTREDDEPAGQPPGRKPPTPIGRPDRQYVQKPRQPVHPARGGQARPQASRPTRKIGRPRPAARKLPAYAETPGAARGLGQLAKKKPLVQRKMQLMSTMEAPEEILADASLTRQKLFPATTSQKPQGKEIIQTLIEFEGSDDLRRGILYYEILGKPVGLRD